MHTINYTEDIMAESINVVCHVKTKGKTGLIKLTLMINKPKYNI
jgi:hypothetical protein